MTDPSNRDPPETPMMGIPQRSPRPDIPTEPPPPKRMDPALAKKRWYTVVGLGLGLPTFFAIVYGSTVMAFLFGILLVAGLAYPRLAQRWREGWRPKGPWWWPKG